MQNSSMLGNMKDQNTRHAIPFPVPPSAESTSKCAVSSGLDTASLKDFERGKDDFNTKIFLFNERRGSSAASLDVCTLTWF